MSEAKGSLNLQKREGKAEACVACKVEKQCTEVNYSKSQLRLPQGQMKCKECTLSSQLAASTVSGILCCGFTEPPSSLAPSGCTLSIRVAQPKLFAPLLPTPFPNTLKPTTNTPACWPHTLFYGPCLRTLNNVPRPSNAFAWHAARRLQLQARLQWWVPLVRPGRWRQRRRGR